jgi:hypothetical protein
MAKHGISMTTNWTSSIAEVLTKVDIMDRGLDCGNL